MSHTANCQRVFWERGTRLSAITSPDGMSQYPAQPYGVQVQEVPQYGYLAVAVAPGYVTPGWYGDLGRCNSVHVVLDVRPRPETEGHDGDGAAGE